MEILRIVRLSFEKDNVDDFIKIFINTKNQIRSFKGCKHLELLKDSNQPNVFFTLSKWESEEALEYYRRSTLFKETWSKTKILFNEKPSAYSMVSEIFVIEEKFQIQGSD